MKCARCSRILRKPGVDVVIGGVPFVFGPVCAAKVNPARRKRAEPVIPRSPRARRIDQPDLFEVMA